MAPFTPRILDIALRVAAERAVSRGGFWAAVTAYVELVSLLVQWESATAHGPQRGWLTHTAIGLAFVAGQVFQLRRPGRLVLHPWRASALWKPGVR